MRLDVSAVQHDMKREEIVEEVEKNTEWERRTPKRKAGDSNSFGRAKKAAKSRFLRLLAAFGYGFFGVALPHMGGLLPKQHPAFGIKQAKHARQPRQRNARQPQRKVYKPPRALALACACAHGPGVQLGAVC